MPVPPDNRSRKTNKLPKIACGFFIVSYLTGVAVSKRILMILIKWSKCGQRLAVDNEVRRMSVCHIG
jgi:hypothetical protein